MGTVNRLATPLPDSVLDRYFAEHPDEVDDRKGPRVAAKAAARTEPCLGCGQPVHYDPKASFPWVDQQGDFICKEDSEREGKPRAHSLKRDVGDVLRAETKTAAVQPVLDEGDFERVFDV